ncbi:MAG: hypothetical protein AAF654_14380 [Myxococcota bacterium]
MTALSALTLLLLGAEANVAIEFPNLLSADDRRTFLNAVTLDGTQVSVEGPILPCQIRVRIEAAAKRRRVSFRSTVSGGNGRSSAFELMRGRRTRRGRVIVTSDALETAAFRLRGAVESALDGLVCEEPKTIETIQQPAALAPPESLQTKEDSFFAISASLGVGQRSFAYRDFLYGPLRDFELGVTPIASVSLGLRPGPVRLRARFAIATPGQDVTVPDAEGGDVGANWLSGSVDAGVAVLERNGFECTVLATGRYDSFEFSGALEPELDNELPTITQLALGGGVAVGWRSNWLLLNGEVHSLYLLSLGNFIESRFPAAAGTGLVARGQLLTPISESLRVGINGEWVRYGLELNPAVGAENVAGGVVDEAWSGGLAVEVQL